MKIRPVRAEFFNADGWTDGRTDTTQLIIAFGNAKTHKKKPLKFSRKTRSRVSYYGDNKLLLFIYPSLAGRFCVTEQNALNVRYEEPSSSTARCDNP